MSLLSLCSANPTQVNRYSAISQTIRQMESHSSCSLLAFITARAHSFIAVSSRFSRRILESRSRMSVMSHMAPDILTPVPTVSSIISATESTILLGPPSAGTTSNSISCSPPSLTSCLNDRRTFSRSGMQRPIVSIGTYPSPGTVIPKILPIPSETHIRSLSAPMVYIQEPVRTGL